MTYPLIGNYGRLAGRRPVRPPVAPGPRRGPRDRGGPRRRPPARDAAAHERDPGDRGRRHPGARPAPAHERLAARDHHRARHDGPRRRRRPCPCRAALGGPGLRRPGLAGRGPRGGRRPRPRRSSRSSTSGSRRTSSVARPARMRVRVLPHTATAADVLAADVAGVVFSPGPATRPGSTARSRSPGRSSTTGGRCWASASGTRSSGGRPAPRPDASGSATTARTTRSRTSTPATSR